MKNSFCQVRPPFLTARCFALVMISTIALFASCSGNSLRNSSQIPTVVTADTKNPLANMGVAATAGKPLFSIHCAMCHGEDGRGEGLAGGSIAVKPTDLTAGSVIADPDGKLFLVIKNGVKKEGKQTMPPAKRVTDEEIWQIVAYMRGLAKK